MKKILATVVVLTMILGTLTACGGKDESGGTSSDSGGSKATTASENIMKSDEAKDIALKDAGVAEKDVKSLSVIHEIDQNRHEYEVDFYSGDKEHEYTLDAKTGEVIEKGNEINKDVKANNANATVSEAKAKNTALAKVDGATDKDITIYLLTDDNKYLYEGKIVYNDKEYEFEIDAETGDIIEWSSESVNDD